MACMSRIFLGASIIHVLLLSICQAQGSKGKSHHEHAAIPVHASHTGCALSCFTPAVNGLPQILYAEAGPAEPSATVQSTS